MAKNKNEKSNIRYSTAYILSGILLAFVTIINMIQVAYLYNDINSINTRTSLTMNSLNRVSAELHSVNEDILSLMANVGNRPVIGADIGIHMSNMFSAMGAFEAQGNLPEAAQRRYNYTKTMIQAYSASLSEMQQAQQEGLANSTNGRMNERASISLRAMYTQNVYPLQVTSNEMLVATINITSMDASKQQAQAGRVYAAVEIIMLMVLVLGEVAIFFIAKFAIRQRREIEEKEKNLAEVDARLKNTRQKASDMAVTNILTGMKNRYALDNDLGDKLENERFNIAVFDMDNFRSINDTYGYDFGDEYLAAVAEKLKEEFSDIAEIYNITGNEFCFVFNRDVTESQAMRYIQDIQNVMSAPYNVLNLTVQLPVSGAIYHYLAGDCLNVNSLLVKLDTTMRMAKMNGGNVVNTVMNM